MNDRKKACELQEGEVKKVEKKNGKITGKKFCECNIPMKRLVGVYALEEGNNKHLFEH